MNFNIPKTGKPITDQEVLVSDLTIATGLIQTGVPVQQEKGAKIMIELMNRPVEGDTNRDDAVKKAQENTQKQ